MVHGRQRFLLCTLTACIASLITYNAKHEYDMRRLRLSRASEEFENGGSSAGLRPNEVRGKHQAVTKQTDPLKDLSGGGIRDETDLLRLRSGNKDAVGGEPTNADLAVLPPPQDPPIPIVLQATGEFGNHIYAIALGKTLEYLAASRFRLRLAVHVRRKVDGLPVQDAKFARAREVARGCFPNVRKDVGYFEEFYAHLNETGTDVASASRRELKQRLDEQRRWLGDALADQLIVDSKGEGDPLSQIETSLRSLRAVVHGMYRGSQTVGASCDGRPCLPSNSSFGLPFLTVHAMARREHWDQFYQLHRDFFVWDKKGFVNSEDGQRGPCCKETPGPDEVVFHLRHFVVEMPRNGVRNGFAELGPTRVANELLANTKSSIAIVSKYSDHPQTLEYAKALRDRNVTTRIVSGQTAAQDFCFLMQSQRELVGTARSTFVNAAGLFSDSPVRIYSLSGPDVGKIGDPRVYAPYEWRTGSLRERFRFEPYNASSGDVETIA